MSDNTHQTERETDNSQTLPESNADSEAKLGEALDSWVPKCISQEDPSVIETIMPIARSVVKAMEPTTEKEAQKKLRVLVAMLLHVYRTDGDLDLETILVSDFIDYYATSVNKHRSFAWKHEARSTLTHIAKTTNSHAWPVKYHNLKRHVTSFAYSDDDEATFRLFGELALQRGRLDEAFMVAASLGAGLSGVEIVAASPTDVEEMGDGRLGIRIARKNPRLVPVRKDYTELMRLTLRSTGRKPFIRKPYSNQAHFVADRIRVKCLGRLSLRRTRSTWLTAHLVAGTSLAALRAIAGPVSANTLNHLLDRASKQIDAEKAAREGLGA